MRQIDFNRPADGFQVGLAGIDQDIVDIKNDAVKRGRFHADQFTEPASGSKGKISRIAPVLCFDDFAARF